MHRFYEEDRILDLEVFHDASFCDIRQRTQTPIRTSVAMAERCIVLAVQAQKF